MIGTAGGQGQGGEGSEPVGRDKHLGLFSEKDGELLERFEQRTESDQVYKSHFGLSVEKGKV